MGGCFAVDLALMEGLSGLLRFLADASRLLDLCFEPEPVPDPELL